MSQHFINDGYGWTCRHCREATTDERASDSIQPGALARFFHEGEAEERAATPRLATPALARWRRDAARRLLYCPLCGVEEEIEAGRSK